jgi:hypothetical protein
MNEPILPIIVEGVDEKGQPHEIVRRSEHHFAFCCLVARSVELR